MVDWKSLHEPRKEMLGLTAHSISLLYNAILLNAADKSAGVSQGMTYQHVKVQFSKN